MRGEELEFHGLDGIELRVFEYMRHAQRCAYLGRRDELSVVLPCLLIPRHFMSAALSFRCRSSHPLESPPLLCNFQKARVSTNKHLNLGTWRVSSVSHSSPGLGLQSDSLGHEPLEIIAGEAIPTHSIQYCLTMQRRNLYIVRTLGVSGH